jgi:hypothetical protein
MIRLKSLLSLSALMLLTGCAASGPELAITRDAGGEYVAHFDRACFSQTTDGQLDLLLIAHGAGSNAAVNRPLETTNRKAIEQIVHVRVLWQHPRDVKLDNPSASNAMIQWHVIGSPQDRIVYSGSCWTRIAVDGDTAKVELREASVSISKVVGDMHDPLKRATLEGKLVAQRSDATVQSYLEELASMDHSNSTAQFGPPTRSPVAP